MADIARLAKVSEATVSRALSDSPLVSAATKERIRKIARVHDYRVNASARNFRLRRAQTIAVLIPLSPKSRQHVSDLFFLDLLGSIADALVDADYDLLLSKPRDDDWQHRFLLSGRSDGLIVIGQAGHERAIDALAAQRVPMAVWGTRLSGQAYCTVGSDNEEGGFLAVSHLIANGRRDIAFFGDAKLPEVKLRFAGYRRALRRHQLAYDPRLYVPTEFTVEAAVASVATLLRDGPAFDAIFASSDVIAMGAIQTLHTARVEVPRQVAVVGYDDIRMAASYTPALTTIRQNIEVGGRELVARLIALIDGQRVGSLVLPTELVVRRSCGAREAA
jgi:DNA-binding LacI/PurR family transcriptional regulator